MRNLLLVLLVTAFTIQANANPFKKKHKTSTVSTIAFNDTVYAGDALENAGIHMTTAFCIAVGTAVAMPVCLFIGVPAGILYIVAEGAIIMTGAFSISTLSKLIRAGKLLKKDELRLIKLVK
jgi:hypothetical protein